MTHENLLNLTNDQIRHKLRPLAVREATRLAANDEEFRELLEVALRRIYSLSFPSHVNNIVAWTVGAIRKSLFQHLANERPISEQVSA